jgi:hypothetical protein
MRTYLACLRTSTSLVHFLLTSLAAGGDNPDASRAPSP